MFLRLLCCLPIACLIGCATTPSAQKFARETPRLDPMAYFTGTRYATGVIEDRFGNVRSRFTALNVGQRHGSTLHLQQTFKYADGRTESRTWELRQVGPHQLTGTANDTARPLRGEFYGNAVRLRYALRQPGIGAVSFDQLMLLQPGDRLINHVRFSKFGVRLGDVHEFFE